jgi:hypothetical protein
MKFKNVFKVFILIIIILFIFALFYFYSYLIYSLLIGIFEALVEILAPSVHCDSNDLSREELNSKTNNESIPSQNTYISNNSIMNVTNNNIISNNTNQISFDHSKDSTEDNPFQFLDSFYELNTQQSERENNSIKNQDLFNNDINLATSLNYRPSPEDTLALMEEKEAKDTINMLNNIKLDDNLEIDNSNESTPKLKPKKNYIDEIDSDEEL